MLGFNGGLMGVRKVPTAGSASGLWLPNEQCVAKRVNIWPAAPGPNSARYFRLANFADTALNDNSIDFGEIEVYNQDFLHTGITCTSNIGWYLGQDSNLVDGVKTTDGRSYMSNWSSIRPTTTITLDLGSTKTVTHIKIFSLYTQPRFPASFDLQSSSDNVTYEKIATVTVGTNFTYLGAFVYSSAKVAIL